MESRDGMNYAPDHLNKEIYSIGLEGLKLDELIRVLLNEDIELVLDIRRSPSRQSPRLPAKRVAQACSDADVYYIHRPELGTSSEFLRSGDRSDQLDSAKYRRYLRQRHHESLLWVGAAARRHRTCVIGCKADPKQSHRRFFLEEVERVNPLRIIHLAPQLHGAVTV